MTETSSSVILQDSIYPFPFFFFFKSYFISWFSLLCHKQNSFSRRKVRYPPTYPTHLTTHLPFNPATCLLYLPAHLSIYLPANPLTHVPTNQPTYPSIHLPTYTLTHSPNHPPTCLTAHLTTHLTIYTPNNLPTYLLAYLPTQVSPYLLTDTPPTHTHTPAHLHILLRPTELHVHKCIHTLTHTEVN